MADAYNLKAGHTITVTANEGRVHVRSGTESSFTRSSVSFGPYLVDTNWLVDGDATVSTAEYTSAFNAYVYPNAGAPEDAAQATLSLNPTGDDNALTATARVYGAEGNSISIEYVDPGVEAPLSVSVFRQKITVSLANDENPAITSTAAEVKAAIEAHTEANQLVSLAIDTSDTGSGDDGSGVVTALAAASLTGGAGTGIGIVPKGGMVVDTTNGALYQNTGTLAVPAYSADITSAATIRGALVTKDADQGTADYTTPAAVSWDLEVYDTDDIHEGVTNPTRLSVPAGVSYVRLTGQVTITGVTTENQTRIAISKNGDEDFAGGASAWDGSIATSRRINISTPVLAVVGGTDYFELVLEQTTDTSVTVLDDRTWFAMEIIG